MKGLALSEAVSDGPGPPPRRDPLLDLLRTLALVRVMAWHTFAFPWLTFFAAMPVLFFVAGALLGASCERRPYGAVLLGRGRRLLVPLWVYGTLVLLTGVLRGGSASDSLAGWGIATWLVPLVDPVGSAWHGGWLSTHLWYVRAYVWVLLVAPWLSRLARRLTRAVTLLVGGLAILELAAWLGIPLLGSGPVHLLVGDALTYGFFVLLGMAYRRPRRNVPPLMLATLAGAAAGAAVLYADVVGLPLGEVNASYPAIVLTGLAWLLAAGAAEVPLRRLAGKSRMRLVSSLVNRRAVTIYLWHPAAIALAYVSMGRWAPTAPHVLHALAVFALAVVFTAAAVLVVGWVEEVAARGATASLRFFPRRPAAVVARVAVTVVITGSLLFGSASRELVPGTSVTAAAGVSRPAPLRPPSYREALKDSAFGRPERLSPRGDIHLPEGRMLPQGRMPASTLQEALDRWLAGQPGVDSVAVAMAVADRMWQGEAHRLGAAPVDGEYRVASLTKTFTVALVLQQVARGRLSLDTPIPELPALRPATLGASITPRQLLQHTSGLVDYPGAVGYDATEPLTPTHAVVLSLRMPLQSTPGAEVHYANVNYLYLGLILEHLTGRPYGELVAELAQSVGLARTRLDPTLHPGWAGFASGGIHSTVDELARFGAALFTPGRILPSHLVAQLATLDEHNLGLGTWPLCPCSTDASGRKRYTAIGQFVGHGALYHYPGVMTVAVHFEPSQEGIDLVSLQEALRAELEDNPGR